MTQVIVPDPLIFGSLNEAGVSFDNIPGWLTMSARGRNGDVDTGSPESIWSPGGIYLFPTVASTLEAISDSANDTAVGSGARTIRISGLDANFDYIEEDVTMNGTTVTTPTSQSFIRVNTVFVLDAGTYSQPDAGGNEGTIDIQISGAGAIQAQIPFEPIASLSAGISSQARISIPRFCNMVIPSASVFADSKKIIDAAFFVRPGANALSAPFSSRILIGSVEAFGGTLAVDVPFQGKVIQGPADFWWVAQATDNNAEITASFTLLVDDNRAAVAISREFPL